jgi:hypothetical protein
MMFNELQALADRHAALHADRARLEADLERERVGIGKSATVWVAEAVGSQAIDPSGQLSAHPSISWG